MHYSTLDSRSEGLRQALCPADPAMAADALVAQLTAGGAAFVDLLRMSDLAAVWHSAIEVSGLKSQLTEPTVRVLADARLDAAARYLAQQHALHQLDGIFEEAGIAYAVMKGVALREVLHGDPSVLLASDIDVLVNPKDRTRAAALLVQAGYSMHLNPGNISHEVTLTSPTADIDLHWNILRPGRTRVDLTGELLVRRVRVNGFWSLSQSDSAFIMLTHPAFAKYVCSPNMGLPRVLSFLLWFNRPGCDWPRVIDMLDRTGLKAAAWMMLGWYTACAPASAVPALTELRAQLQPSRLRAAYLEFWLRHDLPTRLIDRPFWIQLGLTAFLHDGPSDAVHAFKGWYAAMRQRAQQAGAFQGQTAIPA